MVHNIKIESKYLARIISGTKKFEVRLNDRDYQVGDILHFEEIRRDNLCRDCSQRKEIAYIHSGLGMQDNYVILGLKEKADG